MPSDSAGNLSEFFDRHNSTIDADKNGVWSRQEVINTFGTLQGADAQTLRAIYANFDGVSTLDHWYSNTVSKKDLVALDEKTKANDAAVRDAVKAIEFLGKNYDSLASNTKGIEQSDIQKALQRNTYPSERSTLEYIRDNFKQIGNCSGDEWVWQKRRISRADIKEYERSITDWLVTDMKFYGNGETKWIPGDVSKQRGRIDDKIDSLGKGWEKEHKAELRAIAYAMIGGNIDELTAAVRKVKTPSDLKSYSEVLNSAFNIDVKRYGDTYEYRVPSHFKAEDPYSEGKPAFIIRTGNFWVHIPLDPAMKPTGWVQESKGFFTSEKSERTQPADLVLMHASSSMRNPHVRHRHRMPPPPP